MIKWKEGEPAAEARLLSFVSGRDGVTSFFFFSHFKESCFSYGRLCAGTMHQMERLRTKVAASSSDAMSTRSATRAEK